MCKINRCMQHYPERALLDCIMKFEPVYRRIHVGPISNLSQCVQYVIVDEEDRLSNFTSLPRLGIHNICRGRFCNTIQCARNRFSATFDLGHISEQSVLSYACHRQLSM